MRHTRVLLYVRTVCLLKPLAEYGTMRRCKLSTTHSYIRPRKRDVMLRSFFATEEGQGLVEYALILVLIAIVVIGILTLLGSKVSQVFSKINSGLK